MNGSINMEGHLSSPYNLLGIHEVHIGLSPALVGGCQHPVHQTVGLHQQDRYGRACVLSKGTDR